MGMIVAGETPFEFFANLQRATDSEERATDSEASKSTISRIESLYGRPMSDDLRVVFRCFGTPRLEDELLDLDLLRPDLPLEDQDPIDAAIQSGAQGWLLAPLIDAIPLGNDGGDDQYIVGYDDSIVYECHAGIEESGGTIPEFLFAKHIGRLWENGERHEGTLGPMINLIREQVGDVSGFFSEPFEAITGSRPSHPIAETMTVAYEHAAWIRFLLWNLPETAVDARRSRDGFRDVIGGSDEVGVADALYWCFRSFFMNEGARLKSFVRHHRRHSAGLVRNAIELVLAPTDSASGRILLESRAAFESLMARRFGS